MYKDKEQYNKKMREMRDIAKSKGVCCVCGAKTDGTYYCGTCVIGRGNKYNKEYVATKERVAAGLCGTGCGKPIGTTSSWWCEEHTQKQRDIRKRCRDKRVSSGGCSKCKSLTRIDGLLVCEICWFKQLAVAHAGGSKHWKQLQDKLIAQEHKCKYTGWDIRPGKNASIDHILPRSAGGGDSIDNLQWVESRINNMKTAFSHEEFIDVIRHIASRENNG